MHGTKQINGTLGIYRKLGAHNNLPPRRKKRKDNVPLQNTFEYGSNGSLREIANVLGMLTSTYQTVLPDPFHYRSLRMQQIKNQVHLTQGCRGELKWWLNNFQLQGKANLNLCSRFQNIISCCNIGSLGSALSRSCDRKTAWQGGKKTGIKQFPGIKAEKMTLMTFTNLKELKTVHLQMNKVTALTYLVKMRTIESSKLTRIALENLEFLMSKSIMMAAKFCQAR